MTFSMTTSSSIGASASLATASADTQTLDSYGTQQTLVVSSGAPSGDGSLTLVMGGEATAIGDDTLALGSMSVDLDGTGLTNSVSANTSSVAAATASGDDPAFATAWTSAAVSGMGHSVVIGSSTEIVQQGPEGSYWFASSETTIYGFDLDADDVSGDEALLSEAVDSPMSSADPWLSLDGNVAMMEASANVYGENTLLDVQVSLLTVEDMLSTVSGAITAVVD